ncbi:hypothetical protein HPB52_012345 [Rhipicephalus sanguineus]|uniref:Uncharacterized protein n=1 Tax=Rhipicephalus sanguineus TaxID=34632 RepID=A0A9D4T9W9_RHISA|nr:hypothetical protein HPB52_012345 [Rhipicephalus sanguineus]
MEIVVLRRRRRKKAKTLSVRLKQRGSKPSNRRRRRSGNHRPKRRRGSGDGQGVTTASGAFTSVVPLPVILCVMDTRFAHLNPDRRSPAMRRNPQVVVAPEGQGNERFGDLTPERRLEELRAEVEKLSQVIGGGARDSELASVRQDRCGELRRYSKVLTGVLPKFPTEAEAPVWFESVESALEAYERNLSEEALRYVTLQEGRQWVNAPELAASLRTFEEAQGMNSAAKQKVLESQSASISKLDTQPSSRGGART